MKRFVQSVVGLCGLVLLGTPSSSFGDQLLHLVDGPPGTVIPPEMTGLYIKELEGVRTLCHRAPGQLVQISGPWPLRAPRAHEVLCLERWTLHQMLLVSGHWEPEYVRIAQRELTSMREALFRLQRLDEQWTDPAFRQPFSELRAWQAYEDFLLSVLEKTSLAKLDPDWGAL